MALCVVAPFSLGALRTDKAAIRRHWKILSLLGALGVGGFNTLVYVGLGETTATNGLLLNSAIPVLIALIGWAVLRQPLRAAQAAGIAISLAGVLAIVFKGDWSGVSALHFNRGDIWVFAAMIDWAIYTLLLAHRPKDIRPVSFLFITIATGLFAILPFYLGELATGARPVFTPGTLAAMAYLGIFPSAVAYLFWNRGVAEVGGNRAGIFIHLMPVFGTLLAAAFLGEQFHAYHALGFALILGGIALTTRRNAQSA